MQYIDIARRCYIIMIHHESSQFCLVDTVDTLDILGHRFPDESERKSLGHSSWGSKALGIQGILKNSDGPGRLGWVDPCFSCKFVLGDPKLIGGPSSNRCSGEA